VSQRLNTKHWWAQSAERLAALRFLSCLHLRLSKTRHRTSTPILLEEASIEDIAKALEPLAK